MSTKPKGKLYLVPSPLDFAEKNLVDLSSVLPAHSINTAAGLQYWICENAKSLRAYLNRIKQQCDLAYSIQEQHISELPVHIHKKGDHQKSTAINAELGRQLLQPALQGHDIGLVSEAGMPAIADPGSSIVSLAHQLEINVVPLVGPISLMLALAASGLNGQNFAFVGYLAQNPADKSKQLQQLEQRCKKQAQAQIFIETPFRNRALVETLLQTLQPDTKLSISIALTLPQQYVHTASIEQWRQKTDLLEKLFSHKTPAIFIIN